MFLFPTFPERHPWPFWLAAPICITLCLAAMLLFAIAIIIAVAFTFWTVPEMPTIGMQAFLVRFLFVVSLIWSIYLLRDYYREAPKG